MRSVVLRSGKVIIAGVVISVNHSITLITHNQIFNPVGDFSYSFSLIGFGSFAISIARMTYFEYIFFDFPRSQ